jgi:hypothetical protein
VLQFPLIQSVQVRKSFQIKLVNGSVVLSKSISVQKVFTIWDLRSTSSANFGASAAFLHTLNETK